MTDQARKLEHGSRLPLSALLSQALVAFTIEFDNEFELRMPHSTTNHAPATGARSGPWLVSLAMWSNCMQFVGDEGVTVGALEDRARTGTNLRGMQRWGYIVVKPYPAGGQSKPPHRNWVIRATAKGRQAQEVWRPLFGVIEERWQARFGKDTIDQLRESLRAPISLVDAELPECLPILRYGLFSRWPDDQRRKQAGAAEHRGGCDSRLPLSALLSRALLAFALEFERESDVSLAISADVVRVLDEKGVRVRDIPILSGVSKEAISMALGVLKKKRALEIDSEPGSRRAKVARLTAKGRETQEAYHQLSDIIEERWRARLSGDAVRALRQLLERLAGDSTPQRSPLFLGLEPYPEGWRASVRKPATLPHYPMVLHRGGFPDGS